VFYADDEPKREIDYIQVHYFCPRTVNPETKIKKIRNALFKAGFSYPSVTRLYEEETEVNHIIFTTEYEKETELED
jgi:heterodisulfide reductase subunit C